MAGLCPLKIQVRSVSRANSSPGRQLVQHEGCNIAGSGLTNFAVARLGVRGKRAWISRSSMPALENIVETVDRPRRSANQAQKSRTQSMSAIGRLGDAPECPTWGKAEWVLLAGSGPAALWRPVEEICRTPILSLGSSRPIQVVQISRDARRKRTFDSGNSSEPPIPSKLHS
jgi:hypothetical protein